ncbi:MULTISPECIES: rhomboid family intramembrane serine protease [unclassified Cyanobium]|uniref:rhomboid family intramembrane serine protease n=1 Tax=unclassified Cyanobium TaxID=2627006 RepID=UPI0020CC9FD6|nr:MULTISPECIES: rhomboid family intramembrane serine protease [unclassified Cyanobium]MCP9833503.1 rhomboid family intramembrane serine protease [Cyanobium sp. La Preciosa 7G6]MCP9936268.1 rhomboid family intramembrane serine protease [Cyanobium sp. Aljojuca 7A6]
MGTGRDLGLQLRQWIATGAVSLDNPQAMSNRLIDALGAEETLRGPLRDLATQPLLLRVLQLQGGPQRSAITALSQHLAGVYAPQVLAELLDLLEACCGVAPPRPAGDVQAADVPPAIVGSFPRSWLENLRPLGPGLALSASGALVLFWAGGELDQWFFDPWRWGSGLVLVVALALLQALALGPLRALRRRWPLSLEASGDPRRAWCWITAPWIHAANAEALLNLVMLAIVLGGSSLPLASLLLRYSLTALATTAPAVLVARRARVLRHWDGASGPIAAVIALASVLSLLHWKAHPFVVGAVEIPAWVLLVVFGAVQLGWQLPRRDPQDSSSPMARLWSSPWCWGTALGTAWALVTRAQELARGLGWLG